VGQFSKLVIPGKSALADPPTDWPEAFCPGSLNVQVDPRGYPPNLPEVPGKPGVQRLDLKIIPPLFLIPAEHIANNGLVPTDADPDVGIGQIWRAKIRALRNKAEVNCWVFRRVGSGATDQLEIISTEHLRSKYGLLNKTGVIVTLWSGAP
jgi:hypothetical protein